jgi:hypothetical protein
MESWVDTAVQNKTWLILVFHQIDLSNDQYGTTPAIFGGLVDYIKSHAVSTVTVQQGLNLMGP